MKIIYKNWLFFLKARNRPPTRLYFSMFFMSSKELQGIQEWRHWVEAPWYSSDFCGVESQQFTLSSASSLTKWVTLTLKQFSSDMSCSAFRWYVDSSRLLEVCVFSWPPVAPLLFSARYRSVTCTQISSLTICCSWNQAKASHQEPKIQFYPSYTQPSFGGSNHSVKKRVFLVENFRKLII